MTQWPPSHTLNDRQVICNFRAELFSDVLLSFLYWVVKLRVKRRRANGLYPTHSMTAKSSETFDTKGSQISYYSGQSESGVGVVDATASISLDPCPTRLVRCLSPSVSRRSFLGTLSNSWFSKWASLTQRPSSQRLNHHQVF